MLFNFKYIYIYITCYLIFIYIQKNHVIMLSCIEYAIYVTVDVSMLQSVLDIMLNLM